MRLEEALTVQPGQCLALVGFKVLRRFDQLRIRGAPDDIQEANKLHDTASVVFTQCQVQVEPPAKMRENTADDAPDF